MPCNHWAWWRPNLGNQACSLKECQMWKYFSSWINSSSAWIGKQTLPLSGRILGQMESLARVLPKTFRLMGSLTVIIVAPPYPQGIHSKTCQWMPETADNTKPYYIMALPIYILVMNFRRSKRSTRITNNRIEQL